MNPWTDEYLQRELATMQHLKPFDNGRLVLQERTFRGIIECYLRDDLNIEGWGPFPLLGERRPLIGDRVWMSLTPREIESQYMPIKLAGGRVGIGGLGLGYATQRILSKPNVDEVLVYEIDPNVIALYERHFEPNPKLRIVQQDVATIDGEAFDFFFNDVYARMLEDATFEHWNTLIYNNSIETYHPWGLEAMLMSFVRFDAKNEVPFYLRHVYFPFLRQLMEALQADEPHGIFSDTCIPPLEVAKADAAKLIEDIWY